MGSGPEPVRDEQHVVYLDSSVRVLNGDVATLQHLRDPSAPASSAPAADQASTKGFALLALSVLLGSIILAAALWYSLTAGLASLSHALPSVGNNSLAAYSQPPSLQRVGLWAAAFIAFFAAVSRIASRLI